MKCADCGLDVKYCSICNRKFKNQSDIVHYIRKNGKSGKTETLHICLSCLNKFVFNRGE